MSRRIRHLLAEIFWFCILPGFACAQLQEPLPKLNYDVISDFFQLPPGEHFVEPAGVAVNSKGHIYVFHRGKHPLMEFDSSGKFLRNIADDLFVTAHMVRVDAEDSIWTTDIGSHVVLKLSPEGRVLLALGRMRNPGDDVGHFNQPTDPLETAKSVCVAGLVGERLRGDVATGLTQTVERSGRFSAAWLRRFLPSDGLGGSYAPGRILNDADQKSASGRSNPQRT